MMKSVFLAGTAAILLTTAAAQAQSDAYRCDEFGCELVPRGGFESRRRLAIDDRYRQQRGTRDGVYCEDGMCSIGGEDCRDGQCRLDGGYCADGRCGTGACDCRDGCNCDGGRCCVNGRCCVDGQCDPLTDCEDGRCDINRRRPVGHSGSFPYPQEYRGREADSRHLDNPFRRAGYRNSDFPGTGRPDHRPIPTSFQPVRYESQRPSISGIRWNSDLRRAAAIATRENRPILVQVSAPWCGYCKQMKQETWTDRGVVNMINNRFVAVEVNADEQRQFIEEMQIQSLPTTLVVSPDLRILKRVQGFQSAGQMLQMLSR